MTKFAFQHWRNSARIGLAALFAGLAAIALPACAHPVVIGALESAAKIEPGFLPEEDTFVAADGARLGLTGAAFVGAVAGVAIAITTDLVVKTPKAMALLKVRAIPHPVAAAAVAATAIAVVIVVALVPKVSKVAAQSEASLIPG